MKFDSHIILETRRLTLRLFTIDDLSDFHRYASVKGVGEMAGWHHHQALEQTSKILKMFIEEKNVLALIDKQSQRVIGSLGVHAAKFNSDEFINKKILEIGYVLAQDFWGRGLMLEAVNRLLRYLFEVENLDYVSCAHFTSNKQSQRVIEKSGFVYHSDDVFYARELDQSFQEKKYIMSKAMFSKLHDLKKAP